MRMQHFNGANEMLGQWIGTEHYRLHCVESLPDSHHKEAVLEAIHSTLERRTTASLPPIAQPNCMICASRRAKTAVLKFLAESRHSAALTRLAA